MDSVTRFSGKAFLFVFNWEASEGTFYSFFPYKFFFEITCLFPPFKKLINGIAQVTFNSETAVKELSYESLEDLNDKYLYIGVTITESTGKSVFPLKLSLGKYLLLLVAKSCLTLLQLHEL